MGEGLRVQSLPDVGEKYDLTRGLSQTSVQRRGFAGPGNTEQTRAPAGKRSGYSLGRVGRTIRNHQDLTEVCWVIQCQERLQFPTDELLAVMDGHQDRNPGTKIHLF